MSKQVNEKESELDISLIVWRCYIQTLGVLASILPDLSQFHFVLAKESQFASEQVSKWKRKWVRSLIDCPKMVHIKFYSPIIHTTRFIHVSYNLSQNMPVRKRVNEGGSDLHPSMLPDLSQFSLILSPSKPVSKWASEWMKGEVSYISY